MLIRSFAWQSMERKQLSRPCERAVLPALGCTTHRFAQRTSRWRRLMNAVVGRIAAGTSLSLLLASSVMAAATPYFESFDGYATGDTAVTNFTEMSTSAWQIASPSISFKGYDDGMSVFSSGVGTAVLTNSSATVNFPARLLVVFDVDALSHRHADTGGVPRAGYRDDWAGGPLGRRSSRIVRCRPLSGELFSRR